MFFPNFLKSTPLILLCLTFPFATFAQSPKGDRILAWQVDVAETQTYDQAFALALNSCMESAHLAFKWTSIETDTAMFDAGNLQIMDIANLYYPAFNVPVELNIAPINTNQLEVPVDLTTENFDSPRMINRFKALLDTVFKHMPVLKLSALNIGNEHNIYMGTETAKYYEYKVFLDEVAEYARAKYFALHGEELNVGTTFAMMEMLKPGQAPLCQYVNESMDVISVTYYPHSELNYTSSVASISNHMDSLLKYYPVTNVPVYMTECGFPSSEFLGSSEIKQAQFYQDIFEVWDTYASRLKYMTIFKLTDWSAEEVSAFLEYYGLASQEFAEFLGTLGVRNWEGQGTDKPAFTQIQCELAERNWCGTAECVITGVNSLQLNQKIIKQDQDYIWLAEEMNWSIYSLKGTKIKSGYGSQIEIQDLSNSVYLLKTDKGSHRFVKY